MERTEYLNKDQYYKNAIDEYTGPDPLKPRYEYIMWLEKNVGKENADVNTCLEKTLQRFQNEPRYTNDTRFVELLILFTRLKGDKLRYFKKLFECELGVKCSIFYKAWSDEFIICHNYLEAYDVLKRGMCNNAQPIEVLIKARREIESYIGKKILSGSASCDLLNISCICYKREEKEEVLEVKNWELNPLKPGQPNNFTCPLYLPEPEDPNRKPMYAKHLVYYGAGELQLEEIQALKYFERMEKAKNKEVQNNYSLNVPASPSSKDPHQLTELSCTVHTKDALKVVQGMWDSPIASDEFKPKESFKVPEVVKTVSQPQQVFAVYNDSFNPNDENAGVSRGAGTGQKPRLSERKPVLQPLGDQQQQGVERGAAKHQLKFGAGEEDIKMEDDLATCLDPLSGSNFNNKPQVPNDWNVDDITCNTKVFNNFLAFSSTPNTKGNVLLSTVQNNGAGPVNVVHQKSENGVLSVILEASKETPGSGSSSNEQKPSCILDVERTLENLDINTNNPFCPKLNEVLLRKINYPNNLKPSDLQDFCVINNRLPHMTKTLKLGDNIYTLTGESFKGAYAKVMRVSCNDKVYALKLEKPPCHWEYYICKEIRKRLDPENLIYFSDISKAFFYQNGSIFLSDFAKYGTLLNVINKYKLSPSKPETPIPLFFCMEVIKAVHFLNTQCNIIHGDIKPDNFIVHSLPTMNPAGPFVQLIDYGRAIDMRLMPKGCEFNYVVTTDGFQCNEMKENKPWTYQTDIYGLAATMHCVLVGDYMKVIKKKEVYVLSKQLPRIHQLLWNPIFNSLLNIESSSKLPDLMEFVRTLKAAYDSHNEFTIRNAFSSLSNILNGN